MGHPGLHHTITMCLCTAEHLNQYGKSRATIDATRCHHWASTHPVLPQRMPWSLISALKEMSCGVVILLSEASVQNSQSNELSRMPKSTSILLAIKC